MFKASVPASPSAAAFDLRPISADVISSTVQRCRSVADTELPPINHQAALPLPVERQTPQARRSPPSSSNPTPTPRPMAASRASIASNHLAEQRQTPQSSRATSSASSPTTAPQTAASANIVSCFVDQSLPQAPTHASCPNSIPGHKMQNLFDIVAVKREIIAKRTADAANVPELACGGIQDGVACALCPGDPGLYQQSVDKEAHVVQHVEASGLTLATNSSAFCEEISRVWQLCFPANYQAGAAANQDQNNAQVERNDSDQIRPLLQENPVENGPVASGEEEEERNAIGDFEPAGVNKSSLLQDGIIDLSGDMSPAAQDVEMAVGEIEDEEDHQALGTPMMSRDRSMHRADVCAVCGEVLAPLKLNRSPNEAKNLFRAKRDHVWKNHAPALPFRCGSCENTTFLRKFDLQRHRKSQHPDMPMGELDGRSAEAKTEDFVLFDKCFPFERQENTPVSPKRPSSAISFRPPNFPSSTELRRSLRKHSVFARTTPISPKRVKLDRRSLQPSKTPAAGTRSGFAGGSKSTSMVVSQPYAAQISEFLSVGGRPSELLASCALEQRRPRSSPAKAARRKVRVAFAKSSRRSTSKHRHLCRLCRRSSSKTLGHVWVNHMDGHKRWICAVCKESHQEMHRLKAKCVSNHPGVETVIEAHSDSVLQLLDSMMEQCFGIKPTDSLEAEASVATDLKAALPSHKVKRPISTRRSSGVGGESIRGRGSRMCRLCNREIYGANLAVHVWRNHMDGIKRHACGFCKQEANEYHSLAKKCRLLHPDTLCCKQGKSSEVMEKYQRTYQACFSDPVDASAHAESAMPTVLAASVCQNATSGNAKFSVRQCRLCPPDAPQVEGRSCATHVWIHHMHVKRYACGQCALQGNVLSVLQQKCLRNHPNIPFVNKGCSDETMRKYEIAYRSCFGVSPLTRHENTANSSLQQSSNKKVVAPKRRRKSLPEAIRHVYTCKLCRTTITDVASVRYHVAEFHHGRNKMFKCSHCNFTTIWRMNVQRHIATLHQGSNAVLVDCSTPSSFDLRECFAACFPDSLHVFDSGEHPMPPGHGLQIVDSKPINNSLPEGSGDLDLPGTSGIGLALFNPVDGGGAEGEPDSPFMGFDAENEEESESELLMPEETDTETGGSDEVEGEISFGGFPVDLKPIC